jgi:exopolysaccharide biosynthesis polyprenyl glycosylphosphotransferase
LVGVWAQLASAGQVGGMSQTVVSAATAPRGGGPASAYGRSDRRCAVARLSTTQRRNIRLRKAGCVAADLIALVCADLLAIAVFPHMSDKAMPTNLLVMLVVFALARLVVLSSQRLYDSRSIAHHIEETRRLLLAAVVSAALMVFAEFSFQLVLPRGLALLDLVFMLVCLAAERELVRAAFRRARRAGRCLRPVIVIGSGIGAIEAVRTIQIEPWSGAKVIGYYADDASPELDLYRFDLGYLGTVSDALTSDLPRGCTGVIIDPSGARQEEVDLLARRLNYAGYFLEILAPLRGIAPERMQAIPLGRLATIKVSKPGNTTLRAAAKRVLDIVGSIAGIIIFAPAWLVCAIAIWIDDGAPFVFRQHRAGLDGQPFRCLKMRTMVKDAEKIREHLRAQQESATLLFKLANDPRITRVGRTLRKTSMDETLQLFNVLKGEMSLVGPRPLPVSDLGGLFDERIADRLRVRPGMTGMWQVSGRSDVNDDDFLKLDLHYVDNWSLFVDLLIIGKTIPAVLSQRGAQ